MQEEDPLTNKEITTINIDLSKNNLSQNINYGDIKPLPLPQMKNIAILL